MSKKQLCLIFVVCTFLIQATFFVFSIKDSSSLPESVLSLSVQPSNTSLMMAPPDLFKPTRPSLVNHTIRKGETLAQIWQRYGALKIDTHKAEKAIKQNGMPKLNLREGDSLELALAPQGGIQRMKSFQKDGSIIVVNGLPGNDYYSDIQRPEIKETEKIVSGTIFSSLAESARDAQIPFSLIDDLVDLLGERIVFHKDMQPGDTFTIIYDHRSVKNGIELDPGPIKAVSISTNGKFYAAIRYMGKDGKAHYYNEKGTLIGDYFLRYPVQFTRVTSVFTDNRLHPILKISRPHRGIDFAAPTGTPVRAVADAVVDRAGYFGNSGNTIRLRHNSSYSTAYLHLSRISSDVKSGSRVSRGQIIGYVGTTGLSTGPHLHFEMLKNTKHINPLSSELPNLVSDSQRIPPSLLQANLKILKAQHDGLMLAQNEVGLITKSKA